MYCADSTVESAGSIKKSDAYLPDSMFTEKKPRITGVATTTDLLAATPDELMRG